MEEILLNTMLVSRFFLIWRNVSFVVLKVFLFETRLDFMSNRKSPERCRVNYKVKNKEVIYKTKKKESPWNWWSRLDKDLKDVRAVLVLFTTWIYINLLSIKLNHIITVYVTKKRYFINTHKVLAPNNSLPKMPISMLAIAFLSCQ